MSAPTTSPDIKIRAASQPFFQSGLPAETAADNIHLHALRPFASAPDNHAGPSITALAHEIRNPLTNIGLAVDMIGSTAGNNDLGIYLDIIKRNSIRIGNLVNELLAYQQAAHAPVQKYYVRQLLEEALEIAGDRLRLKKISVRKDYAEEDSEIARNGPNIRIALANIIINAIDAMEFQKGELKLVTRAVGHKYIIQIEDNGCGISNENLKNIFKPYFSLKPGGLGLGLATTYDILKSAHVGMFVASEEQVGTRFILLFDTTGSR